MHLRHSSRLLALTLLAVALPCSTAFAEGLDEKEAEAALKAILETYDKDKDGILTWEEVRSTNVEWANIVDQAAARSRDFDDTRFKYNLSNEAYLAYDRNEDQRVGKDEMLIGLKASKDEWFLWLSDKDIEIQAVDIANRLFPQMLRRFDRNRDGHITAAELRDIVKTEEDHAKFNDADTDKDGRISTAEFQADMVKSMNADHAARLKALLEPEEESEDEMPEEDPEEGTEGR